MNAPKGRVGRWFRMVFLPLTFGGLLSPLVLADLYRCAASNGAIAYQQQPCQGIDKQRTINDNELQKRLRAELAKESADELVRQDKLERDRVLQKRREKIEEKKHVIQSCLAREFDCEAFMYSQNLKCMTPYEVTEVMGAPRRTQNIGGKTYIYYDVPAHNRKHFVTARLQLIVGYCNDLPTTDPMNSIGEINVY